MACVLRQPNITTEQHPAEYCGTMFVHTVANVEVWEEPGDWFRIHRDGKRLCRGMLLRFEHGRSLITTSSKEAAEALALVIVGRIEKASFGDWYLRLPTEPESYLDNFNTDVLDE